MSVVALVSGGLDSTVMAALIRDEGLDVLPLFIDYNQRARDREWSACQCAMESLGLPRPDVADLAGYGRLLPSGLTDATKDVFVDAFLPGRNLLFVLVAAAYAYQRGAGAIALGLLDEGARLFPDQSRAFVRRAEGVVSFALGQPVKILTPLMRLTKPEVVRLAQAKGIAGTYSCHAGGASPCGVCISCREFETQED